MRVSVFFYWGQGLVCRLFLSLFLLLLLLSLSHQSSTKPVVVRCCWLGLARPNYCMPSRMYVNSHHDTHLIVIPSSSSFSSSFSSSCPPSSSSSLSLAPYPPLSIYTVLSSPPLPPSLPPSLFPYLWCEGREVTSSQAPSASSTTH